MQDSLMHAKACIDMILFNIGEDKLLYFGGCVFE